MLEVLRDRGGAGRERANRCREWRSLATKKRFAPRCATSVCIQSTAGLNLTGRIHRGASRSSNGALVVAVSMRIGTRKSTRAIAQTEDIARRLSAAAPD